MVLVNPPVGWEVVILLIGATQAILYILCAIRLLTNSKNPYVAYRSPGLMLLGQVNFFFFEIYFSMNH